MDNTVTLLDGRKLESFDTPEEAEHAIKRYIESEGEEGEGVIHNYSIAKECEYCGDIYPIEWDSCQFRECEKERNQDKKEREYDN